MLFSPYLIMVGRSRDSPHAITFTSSGNPMGSSISGRNTPELPISIHLPRPGEGLVYQCVDKRRRVGVGDNAQVQVHTISHFVNTLPPTICHVISDFGDPLPPTPCHTVSHFIDMFPPTLCYTIWHLVDLLPPASCHTMPHFIDGPLSPTPCHTISHFVDPIFLPYVKLAIS